MGDGRMSGAEAALFALGIVSLSTIGAAVCIAWVFFCASRWADDHPVKYVAFVAAPIFLAMWALVTWAAAS